MNSPIGRLLPTPVIALEVFDRREFRRNGRKGLEGIAVLLKRDQLRHAGQNLQRLVLRCAEAEPGGDAVDGGIRHR